MHRLPLILALVIAFVAAPGVVLSQSTPVLQALPLVAHAEKLDTLVREPMLLEHPRGTLFVSGYNRVRPRLWKSDDGGASWKSVDVGTPTQGAIGNSDVDLAVAPDGTLYLAVLTFDRSKGEGVRVAVGASRDVGATWHWTTVSHTRFDDRPWIAVTPSGTAHLVWNNDRGVWHSASRDRGTTWTTPARVHDRGGSSHLAAGPHGELAVRIIPGAASGNRCATGTDLVAISTDGGMTWQTRRAPGAPRPTGCLDVPGMLPRWVDPLAWDATGALYALWTDTAGVWVGRSTNRATTWTTWRICHQDTAAPSYYPYLTARARGELAASWMIGVGDTIRWRAARIRVADNRRPPAVAISTPTVVEGWTGDPLHADAGGEYFATAALRDGSMGVVTPIQHQSAGRLGFAWSRFRMDSTHVARSAARSCGRGE